MQREGIAPFVSMTLLCVLLCINVVEFYWVHLSIDVKLAIDDKLESFAKES